jgi:hypothetical protein
MCRLSRTRSPGGTTLEEVVREREREASTTAPNRVIGGFFGGGRAVICHAWWAMIQ